MRQVQNLCNKQRTGIQNIERTPGNQKKKCKQPSRKLVKTCTSQKGCPNGQWPLQKVLNYISHQGNAN